MVVFVALKGCNVLVAVNDLQDAGFKGFRGLVPKGSIPHGAQLAPRVLDSIDRRLLVSVVVCQKQMRPRVVSRSRIVLRCK